MNKLSLYERFDSAQDEYHRFERIEHPLNRRRDLCAFMMLDAMLPSPEDGRHLSMIVATGHDEFFLDIDMEALEEVITDSQIQDLVRCGVRYDTDNSGLCMYT